MLCATIFCCIISVGFGVLLGACIRDGDFVTLWNKYYHQEWIINGERYTTANSTLICNVRNLYYYATDKGNYFLHQRYNGRDYELCRPLKLDELRLAFECHVRSNALNYSTLSKINLFLLNKFGQTCAVDIKDM